jgi:hypothetical protein
MRNHFRQRLLILTLCFTLSVAAFGGLWALRSWNLWNGDGEFCCKQTIGKSAFAITLSRCPLTHLGYRYLFQAMNPLTGWWVEDIIAVSSCTAGLVFFWAAVLLARGLFSARLDRILYVAFCSSSLLLQVFCGHIEFYPWACALVMVLAWLAFWHLDGRLSIFWPSAALALATAFHSSAVFYFPGIVALEFVRQSRDPRHTRRARWHSLFCLVLFVCLAPFHRYQTQYALFLIFCLVAWFVWGLAPRRVHVWREGFQSWLVALAPWVVYFSIRTALGFYAEPILHHIAPMGEPYDHGSFLYTFWSWEHLHDKLLFQWWLSPFAIPVSVLIAVTVKRAWPRDARLFFLGVFALSALGWEILFYPQLRIRDWDLFASTAIPLEPWTSLPGVDGSGAAVDQRPDHFGQLRFTRGPRVRVGGVPV